MKVISNRFLISSIVSIICIILLQSISSAARDFSVLIDPGHGGSANGTSGTLNGTTYYEDDLNLDYANNLYSKIDNNSNHPFLPFQTRVADVIVLNSKRAKMANNESGTEQDANDDYIPSGGVDIFLSIHCNGGSATNPGTETLYYASSDAGMKLATIVHQFFMKSVRGVFTSANSRWVKTENITVLSDTKMPAILVETDFMCVQDALKAMITSAYKNAVGTGLNDALLLVDPGFKQHCWGFTEITGSLSYYQNWGGPGLIPVLIRNTTSHGSVGQPINPEYVTYYQRDGSLYIDEGVTIVLDDKVIFCEGTNGEIIDDGAELVIGQGSSFNGVTTGIEDYVNITLAPDYLEQNSSGNIVRAQACDVEPYGNICDLSACELFGRSIEGDVLLSESCTMYDIINGYWEFEMSVPSLAGWNNTWIRNCEENDYIQAYFKVINGSISDVSSVLILSPPTTSGTISKNESWAGTLTLTGNVTISSGVALYILPGTTVKFNSGKSLNVYGILDAQGTEVAPIFFTSSQSSPSIGDWYRIYFGSTSDDANCILKFCEIEYANYGVYAYSSYPTVHSCWIHDNTYGLRGSSSSMIVNNNKIYNNSQDGGYYYGGTPKFYTNTFYSNTGNGLKFYYSSGKIGYTSGTSQGKNEIRDNGSWGIYAQHLTEIFMGSSDSENNRIGGYNAVMNNVINEVCSYDAHVEAEYNYWGTSSPTSGLFTLVYGGTIDYLPPVTSNPNGGSGLSKSVGSSVLDNIANNGHNRWAGYDPANLNMDKLSDLWLYGLELTLHNCPGKAIEIYKLLIEKFPESKEAKKAMVKIHHLLRESDEKSQENYFDNLLQKERALKEEYKSTALTLAAHTYIDMDQPIQAVRTFEKVVEEYPDSSYALDALFSLFMLNLNSFMDTSSARAYLEIMKREYPCDDQTLIAQTDMGEKVDWSVLNSKQLPKPRTETIDIPTKFALHNNYPNPFNPITNIRFDLPEATYVTITIYDITGREVVKLVNRNMNPGYRHLIWNARDKYGHNVSSGIYIYQMRTSAGFNKTKKMMLVR